MRGTKTFVLLLVLLCGPFISLGKYVEEASEKKSWWDKAEVTDDTRLMEDEGEEEEEEEYGRDEREEEEEYNRDVDREKYEQEERDAGEELVHIPEQSSEEPLQEEASDDDEDNPREFDEEEEEVDNFQDGRMMDQDEGGMSLAGQTEKDVPDQTAFESFKKKVEEINKANKEMQAEINKLKVEFDKALSSDSNNDEGRSAPIPYHGTFLSDSQKNVQI